MVQLSSFAHQSAVDKAHHREAIPNADHPQTTKRLLMTQQNDDKETVYLDELTFANTMQGDALGQLLIVKGADNGAGVL